MLWKWKLDEGNKFVTKKKERQLVGLTKLVNKDESWGREWLMNESVYDWRKTIDDVSRRDHIRNKWNYRDVIQQKFFSNILLIN